MAGKVLFIYLICLSSLAFGQKEELNKLCQSFEETITGKSTLHLQYRLTVTDRNDLANKQSMTMDLYKDGNQQKMTMGDAQDIVQDGNLSLMVNHYQKTMVMAKDSTLMNYNSGMLSDLTELVGLAEAIKKYVKNGLEIYVLSYSTDYIYKKLRFEFHAKNKRLKSIYAEFSETYPEPYHTVEVDYQLWDFKWKPDSGFPHLDQFVTISNGICKPIGVWRDYQFYQPQKGTLKF